MKIFALHTLPRPTAIISRFACAALLVLLAIFPVYSLGAQVPRDTAENKISSNPLPVKKITIFSSGIAYYEHSGRLSGSTVFNLPFITRAVNDALKSLVINDPASANPMVSYQSEQTLYQTLKSLSIDLYGNPSMAQILSGLRGAEVEITAPAAMNGRIVGIEYRSPPSSLSGEANEPWLLLSTSEGLKLFNLKEINTLSFTDQQIRTDLGRSLDIIASSRQNDSRDLVISLPGTGSRQVSLSYVIPSPVWKVSYRLDLGSPAGTKDGVPPVFQGWAIVDNDSDTDWNNVTLSLVAGRPVSFIQNLYPPYYVHRPMQPLSIAGTASAQSHDAGYGIAQEKAVAENTMLRSSRMAMYADDSEMMDMGYPVPAASPSYSGSVVSGSMQTMQGSAAGDQFEFTVSKPVSLDRRMSVMLPLVESKIEARKVLIFSGSGQTGKAINPRLGAQIANTSGMKLPAGPITVYDGGTYAGDALIEFWNEDEKRLISFGEDLSVTGIISASNTRKVSSVSVSGGVMTINRSQDYFKSYTFKNNGALAKQLVVEHPRTSGAELVSPEADEHIPSGYRFTMTLSPERELVVTVCESQPLSERITLLSLRPDTFLSYASNQEIPQSVRAALERAIELKRAADAAQIAANEIQNRRTSLISEQDRMRKNLEAAGNQTQQGQEYLKRLVALDNDIDRQTRELQTAQEKTKVATAAYEKYLNELKL